VKLLALDPGGTTGWATFELEVREGIYYWKGALKNHFECGQIGNNSNHHLKLWCFLHIQKPDRIICERFDNRDNEFAKIMAREYIGVVKLYCAITNCPVELPGSDRKEWTTNIKLSLLGILATPITTWRHANDASRHLVAWIAIKGEEHYPGIRRPLIAIFKEASEQAES